jgi:hypothetical protein
VSGLDRVRELAWPATEGAQAALERGEVVALPGHGFTLEPAERSLLDAGASDGRAKNISFDPASGRVGHAALEGEALETARAMMRRFCDWARELVTGLAPGYAAAIQPGKTSFRPCQVEGRALSPRKDDARLHVDAFPSQPVQGRRILRVFANIDPEGRPRVWNLGEPFEAFAGRFSPKAPSRAGAWVSGALAFAKGPRTPYDAMMLALHDGAKLDEAYQGSAPRQRWSFAAGSSWVVFTDAALHAALSGQHALEQTFLVPVQAMAEPDAAPLKVLERMTGRRLA